jgi:hypothetical protein
MLTLKEYELAALKIISKWRQIHGKLLVTDDLLGRMIRFMGIADWKYEEGKSKLSRHNYRQMRAIYAIREYLEEKKCRRKYEDLFIYNLWDDTPEYNEKAGRRINFLIKNANLNQQERLVIDDTLRGLNVVQIAENMGINYDKCRNLYESSVDKMRRLLLNKDDKYVERSKESL